MQNVNRWLGQLIGKSPGKICTQQIAKPASKSCEQTRTQTPVPATPDLDPNCGGSGFARAFMHKTNKTADKYCM